MKLNLLPNYVSKEGQVKRGVIISILLFVASLAAMLGLITISQANLAAKKRTSEELKPQAEEVVTIANQADTLITNGSGIARNVNLATEMIKHNGAYPALYDYVKPYLPRFLRVSSMSVVPLQESNVQLTVTGFVKSAAEYRDLMLALLRIPGATTVTRAGFQTADQYVPALTVTDQAGRPIRPGEAPLPDDPLQRLDYFIAQGGTTGYTGVGGFGAGPENPARGAMPLSSQVTMTVTFPFEYPAGNPVYRGLLGPDAVATLRAAGGAPAAGGVAVPAGPPAGVPGGGAPTTGPQTIE